MPDRTVRQARGPAVLRAIHRRDVLAWIRAHGPTSRTELAQSLHLARSTVSQVVDDLMELGLVVEPGTRGHSVTGRKPTHLQFHPGASHVGAISLGPGSLRLGVGDLAGTVTGRIGCLGPPEPDRDRFLDRLAQDFFRLLEENGVPRERLVAVGVATPGVIRDGTIVDFAPNLPDWRHFSLEEALSRRLGVPVTVENDIRCALLAEVQHGRAKGRRDVLFLATGTGVGAALMLRGRLVRGRHGAAGEIGYWLASPEDVNRDWLPQGRMEQLLGTPGLIARAQQLGAAVRDVGELLAALQKGHPGANQALNDWQTVLVLAVTNLQCLLDLDTVILGGDLVPLMAGREQFLESSISRHAPRPVAVLPSSLGEDAGLLGALHSASILATDLILGAG